ncbi:MAG: hypothetical protein JO188_18760 [Hyphomicrobiales bacterium]|nr:hypothetical protein [Hyphomicrobiales bacterium]
MLIYAAAGRVSEAAKQRRALACIEAANFGTSGQVLAEFYTNVTRNPTRPLARSQALDWIERLAEFPVIPISADLVRMAVGVSRQVSNFLLGRCHPCRGRRVGRAVHLFRRPQSWTNVRLCEGREPLPSQLIGT